MNLKGMLLVMVSFSVAVLIGCKGDIGPVKSPSTLTCKQCPVKSDSINALEFAAQVTAFIAKHADTGLLPNSSCDSFRNHQLSELPVDRYLGIFERNEGTASCTFAAALVVKILLDNGIDAYCYSFGFPEIDLSHMVVVVKADGRFYLFDPFINYALANEQGEPLPLDVFFANVLDSSFRFNYVGEPVLGDLTVDFSLIDTNKLMLNESQVCSDWAKGYIRIYDDVHQIKISRSYDDELNRPCNSFIKRLEKHLRAQTTLQTFGQAMLIKTGDISGAEDQLEVDSLLRAMLKMPSEKWHYRSNTAAVDSVAD